MKIKTSIITRLAALLAGAFCLGPVTASAAVHTFIVSNTNNAGVGSLRETMNAAMTHRASVPLSMQLSDEWLLRFSIPGPSGTTFTIRPTSELPEIDQSITIDGTTQSGYAGTPLIEISGENAGGLSDGFRVGSDEALTLRGVALNRFQGFGIWGYNGSGLTVTGCRIGTNPAGTAARTLPSTSSSSAPNRMRRVTAKAATSSAQPKPPPMPAVSPPLACAA